MTHKLVTLKLTGDLAQKGFQVALEIGLEGDRPWVESVGTLPPNAMLMNTWQAWKASYHGLKSPTRIRPLEISYHGSINAKIGECAQQAKTFHHQFQQWLTAQPFEPLTQLLREELNRADQIRIVIRTDDLALQHMPWHLWTLIDRYPFAEIGLSALSTQRAARQHNPIREISTVEESSAQSGNVRVLAILGHSDGIDVEVDRQLIATLPNANVTYLVEPAREQLNEELWNQPWDILFFAGHSVSQSHAAQANEASLVNPQLANPQLTNPHLANPHLPADSLSGRLYINPRDSLTIDELSYGFRQAIANGLQLAIFNSCDGLGLAHQLKSLGLPHMILMREPVPDCVAQTFLRHFLTAYAEGESLYIAEKQARERLQGLENTFPCASWLPIMVHSSSAAPPTWQQLQQQHTVYPISSAAQLTKAPEKKPFKQTSVTHGPRRSNKQWALKSSVLTALLVSGIRWIGGFQPLELRTFDHLMGQHLPTTTTERLLIVEVTETDLNTYGYPLPDKVLADAIAALNTHSPRIIGLDIFRPQPTDPSFRQTLSNTPQLVTACSPGNPDNPNRPGFAGPPGVPEERLGFTTIINDPDGVIRRQLMFAHDPNTACDTRFSLSTLMALHYLEAEDIYPETLENQQVQLGQTTFSPIEKNTGPYHNVDSWGSQIFVGYTQADTLAERITLSDLLNQQTPLDDLSQTAVLIGVTAPISNPTDYFLTPQGARQWPQQKTAGVVLHAQMLNHLLVAALEGKGVIRAVPGWGAYGWIAAWAVVGGGIAVWQVRTRLWALTLGGGVVVLYGLCSGAFLAGSLVPLPPAVLALVLSSATAHSQPFNTKHDKR